MTKTNKILKTLNQLHAAQENHDLDEMLSTFSADGFVSISEIRADFKGCIKSGAFKQRKVDLTECEIFIYRNYALVRPVIYLTREGKRFHSFHLSRGDDEYWRIIDTNRSQSIHNKYFGTELIANAGKVVGSRGMLWIRRLDAPIEEVWNAISTKEGLEKWWLTSSVEIDLQPGGLFRHHWTNRVRDCKANEYIDFESAPSNEQKPDYLMRFEVIPDGRGTLFSFFDSFNGFHNPLILPWTASGWHGTVDALETALTGRDVKNDFGIGCEFYWRYLRIFHNYANMESQLEVSNYTSSQEWRDAYLTPPEHMAT